MGRNEYPVELGERKIAMEETRKKLEGTEEYQKAQMEIIEMEN